MQIAWRPDGLYPLQGAWNDAREAGYDASPPAAGPTHLYRQG